MTGVHTGRLRLWLVAAGVVLVYAPTAAWLWGRWTMSVWQDVHGVFIPPLVAWLVHDVLRRTPARTPDASAWGYAFIIPALLLHIVDTAMRTQLLSALSLVLLLPGLSLLLLGATRTRALAFPLGFSLFALPIPLSLTESLHLVLRHVATTISAAIVPLVGIPVFAEGTTLHIANASLVVGDACSGFSTLYAAAAVACLTAHQATGWRRKLLVVTAAAPLAIAANVLRITILVAVVAATGVDVLSTWIHPASGMLTFALALPVIFALGGTRAADPAADDAVRRQAVTPVPEATNL